MIVFWFCCLISKANLGSFQQKLTRSIVNSTYVLSTPLWDFFFLLVEKDCQFMTCLFLQKFHKQKFIYNWMHLHSDLRLAESILRWEA